MPMNLDARTTAGREVLGHIRVALYGTTSISKG